LESQLDEVKAGRPSRAVEWAQAALRHADVEVSLAFVDLGEDARDLETRTIEMLPQEHLRNKAVIKKLAKQSSSDEQARREAVRRCDRRPTYIRLAVTPSVGYITAEPNVSRRATTVRRRLLVAWLA
jgi:DNA integrity scanning protein DisA with diadenylate cyclase activity